MKDLLQFVVERLVDKPQAAVVSARHDGDVEVLTIAVDEADKGKVIGRQGKVVQALRTLAGIAAQKAGRRVVVEVD